MRYLRFRLKAPSEEFIKEHGTWRSTFYNYIQGKALFNTEVTNKLPGFYSKIENLPEKITLHLDAYSYEVPLEALEIIEEPNEPLKIIQNGFLKTFN